MITHLFYQQEQVEEPCAVNSWLSIREWIAQEDEIIVLDLGATLTRPLEPPPRRPKYFRLEQIRTDRPEERSYTFGLNQAVPTARGEWICLWRSDYVYHRHYYPELLAGMREASAVVPYEALIGAHHCGGTWCRLNLDWLRSASEDELLRHAHVCPVYEMSDFPHFALRKELWTAAGGMNPDLWGYGAQFPELFHRMAALPGFSLQSRFGMTAFHQNHKGSFGLGHKPHQQAELEAAEIKLERALGGSEAAAAFKAAIRREPLRPRRDPALYFNHAPRHWRGIRRAELLFQRAARLWRRS